jgi:hypothetical protein
LRVADFTELSERYGHARLQQCWSYDAAARPESAVTFLARTRRGSTRIVYEPRRIGTFVVGHDWEVELFDQTYIVTRRAT